MAATEEEAQLKPRYSPEEVLKQLSEIPAEQRTFSASKFLESINCQHETLMAMKTFHRNKEGGTLAEVSRIIMLFLKNIYNMVSRRNGWTLGLSPSHTSTSRLLP